jgi:hypothetical protein
VALRNSLKYKIQRRKLNYYTIKIPNMAWSTYFGTYVIVYSDGQRSESGSNLNLESRSESQAIDLLKRQNNVPQNAQIVIKNMKRI